MRPPEVPPPRLKGAPERKAEVMLALDGVMDPELDESVAAMGFVESVVVEDGAVDVAFRLPTFWCSANFAFLMASDMKTAVEALPWAETVAVRLVDHFAARRISDGLAQGWDFQRVFSGEATEGLERVRRTFREKAYLGRQEALLRLLLDHGDPDRVLSLDMAGVARLAGDADPELAAAARRYVSARRIDGGPAGPDDPAFTTLDGATIPAESLREHLRAIRRIRGSAQANAELCRIQLEARYAGAAAGQGTTLEGARLEEPALPEVSPQTAQSRSEGGSGSP
jgi:metal-sulfur cluster biosynthetic enzyme